MLKRMWAKGNIHKLLGDMQISLSTLIISMGVPQGAKSIATV